mgnify:CR=1 FL=1|jgi:sialic acid synthase SpsE
MEQEFVSKVNSSGCYVIAEAGLNHNGSINIAKKLIDLAAKSGVDAVKFQKRSVDSLAIRDTLDAEDNRFPEFGKTYRQIREYLEFDKEEYKELKSYSESKGLDFLCTAFDIEAVDFLENLGVLAYKLASHSLTNIPLLEYLSKIGKPTFLSTGMASLEEIDTAVNIFKNNNCTLFLFHCVSSYPTPLNDCNLNAINTLASRFNMPVGYSGHEIGFLPTLTAVSMGASIVERHFTLDKSMVGFDHALSLEPNELISMVQDIRNIAIIKGDGKKIVSEVEMMTRDKYHVSMVSSQCIASGDVLTKDMVNYRNPGTGIAYKNANIILGKRAKNSISEDVLLNEDMFK